MKMLLKRASRRLDIGAALGALVRELPNTRDGSPMGRKTRSASRPEKRKSNPIGGLSVAGARRGASSKSCRANTFRLKGASTLLRQNKPRGYACVSCSYAKPADAKTFEFCENGAKATAWEITNRRFFTEHTVSQLYAEGSKDTHQSGETCVGSW